MEKVKLLGYYTTEQDDGENSDGHACGSETYHFVVEKENKEKKEFTFTKSWGSCGSGYCSASWGDMDLNLVNVYKPENEIIRPNKDIELYLNVNFIHHNERSQEFDANLMNVTTTDNEELVYHSGNGGCNYYPSGEVYLNEELFKKLPFNENYPII